MSEEVDCPVATSSQTVGPFFAFGLTTNAALGNLARGKAAGPPIRLLIRVVDGDNHPVPDAVVEVWHADHAGGLLFGRLGTDENGACAFDTVRPGSVFADEAPAEAAHINICVFMRGLLRHLYTRVYFSDDPALHNDAVLRLVPQDRRSTLVAELVADVPDTWSFEVRLQGDRETVYFDL